MCLLNLVEKTWKSYMQSLAELEMLKHACLHLYPKLLLYIFCVHFIEHFQEPVKSLLKSDRTKYLLQELEWPKLCSEQR